VRPRSWQVVRIGIFDAHYLDIVPHERVVYAYEMTVHGRKISASLATIQFFPEGDRTRLVVQPVTREDRL